MENCRFYCRYIHLMPALTNGRHLPKTCPKSTAETSQNAIQVTATVECGTALENFILFTKRSFLFQGGFDGAKAHGPD